MIINFILLWLGQKDLRILAKEYKSTVIYLTSIINESEDKILVEKFKKAEYKAKQYMGYGGLVLLGWIITCFAYSLLL